MKDTLRYVFPNLTEDQIEKVAKNIIERNCRLGEICCEIEEGKARRGLLIIKDGELDLFRGKEGKEEHVARLFKNEILGEGVLFEPDKPHTVSCRAVLDSTVLWWRKRDIEKFLLDELDIANKIFKQIAHMAFCRLKCLSIGEMRKVEHPIHEGQFLEIPINAYYGVQTELAKRNFCITGIGLSHFPSLIQSLAMIKKAAARANEDSEEMKKEPNPNKKLSRAEAIIHACNEIIQGNPYLLKQFVVDVIQGGAGTSTNMNANEVIAKRAQEILGHPRNNGVIVDPNDHVNMCQSTNDVYPTAIRLTIVLTYKDLTRAMEYLIEKFREKANEFKDIIKMGRTQLQDAVPMTLGQEFGAFAETIEEDVDKLDSASKLFEQINLGGTAIGTGVTADEMYCEKVINQLNNIIKNDINIDDIDLKPAKDLVEATWDTGAFVLFSSALKRLAVKLSKICNDLRLLNSGPGAGFGDIKLPPVQAGSSIMPGKVNPVIPEVVNQVAFQVIGNDLTVTMAAEAGQLQLNAFEPIIAFNIFQSLEMLTRATRILANHIKDVQVSEKDKENLRKKVEESPGLATFLIPVITYKKASEIVKDVLETGRSVKEIVLEQKLMTEEEWKEFMKPENLTRPHRMKKRE